jgi:hypothetical protein
MEIKEAHRELLRELGLKDEDFDLFDGKFVTYEYDGEKGVRIYDPYYATSYDEYIDSDGWSAWSVENDTFMSDILKPTHETVQRIRKGAPGADREEITEALKKKFGKAVKEDEDPD